MVKQLSQGSIDWLQWRRQGVGASEIPCLMGESSFATPFQLWEEKTGRSNGREVNYAMQRGIDAEPKIRALYELHNDMDMPPTLAQHRDLTYMRASLDGYNSETGIALEIKYPSREKHEEAKNGKVPLCYFGQCQAQLFVTGAKRVDYVSYDGSKIAVVQVFPDLKYIERMLGVAQLFWDCVETDTPPPLTDKDFDELKDPGSLKLFREIKAAKLAVDQAAEAYEMLRKKVIESIKLPRVRCAGVQMIRLTRKGAVDYSKIPELKSIDLDKFRRKPSEIVESRIKKESA